MALGCLKNGALSIMFVDANGESGSVTGYYAQVSLQLHRGVKRAKGESPLELWRGASWQCDWWQNVLKSNGYGCQPDIKSIFPPINVPCQTIITATCMLMKCHVQCMTSYSSTAYCSDGLVEIRNQLKLVGGDHKLTVKVVWPLYSLDDFAEHASLLCCLWLWIQCSYYREWLAL